MVNLMSGITTLSKHSKAFTFDGCRLLLTRSKYHQPPSPGHSSGKTLAKLQTKSFRNRDSGRLFEPLVFKHVGVAQNESTRGPQSLVLASNHGSILVPFFDPHPCLCFAVLKTLDGSFVFFHRAQDLLRCGGAWMACVSRSRGSPWRGRLGSETWATGNWKCFSKGIPGLQIAFCVRGHHF